MSSPDEAKIALEAARAAGDVIRRSFRQDATVRAKESGGATYNLVSDTDLEAERVIVEVIRRSFPDDAVLGEESHQGDAAAPRLWVVDPLDGTNNFAHGIPHFAISVAFYEAEQPVCGVIYNPIREDLYTAERGGGAFHNGRRVHVSPAERLDETLIGVGFYYDRGAMMEATLAAVGDLFRRNIHGIRRFGTASLDLCHVGCGLYGAFFEYMLSPWDFAAGFTAARVTTARGDMLKLEKTSLLASNGRLHDAVLDVIRGHHPK
ncbi:MAG: inositol monophosphatase [Planctomycetes bacterium]|nr:inositol monophosphatase [Planctomycetota bacterium]